jgi:hypothetical protein
MSDDFPPRFAPEYFSRQHYKFYLSSSGQLDIGFAKQGFRYPSPEQNTRSNERLGVENHGIMVQASH